MSHLTLLLLFCQLPIYFIVSLGCYGLLMVGIGLMYFPTCPQEALLLQQVLYFACSCHAGMRLLMSNVFYEWMPSFCLIIKLFNFQNKICSMGEGSPKHFSFGYIVIMLIYLFIFELVCVIKYAMGLNLWPC